MVDRKGRAWRNLDRVAFDVRGVGGVQGEGIPLPIIEGFEGGDTTGGVTIGAVVFMTGVGGKPSSAGGGMNGAAPASKEAPQVISSGISGSKSRIRWRYIVFSAVVIIVIDPPTFLASG